MRGIDPRIFVRHRMDSGSKYQKENVQKGQTKCNQVDLAHRIENRMVRMDKSNGIKLILAHRFQISMDEMY